MFKLLLHYQALQSRGEQDAKFWKEIVVAFVNNKHNTETLQNEYPISMYQGGPLHELYFITIDNWGLPIIGSNKKIVTTHVVRELKVLI